MNGAAAVGETKMYLNGAREVKGQTMRFSHLPIITKLSCRLQVNGNKMCSVQFSRFAVKIFDFVFHFILSPKLSSRYAVDYSVLKRLVNETFLSVFQKVMISRFISALFYQHTVRVIQCNINNFIIITFSCCQTIWTCPPAVAYYLRGLSSRKKNDIGNAENSITSA